jgi:hypothetical protein
MFAAVRHTKNVRRETYAVSAAYRGVKRRLRSVPWPLRLLLGVVSFGLVIASLGIDQTATSTDKARHLGFGYPLHFASSDFTSTYGPLIYPQETFRLNPWEVPVSGDVGAFVLDWGAVYAVLIVLTLALRGCVTSSARLIRHEA